MQEGEMKREIATLQSSLQGLVEASKRMDEEWEMVQSGRLSRLRSIDEGRAGSRISNGLDSLPEEEAEAMAAAFPLSDGDSLVRTPSPAEQKRHGDSCNGINHDQSNRRWIVPDHAAAFFAQEGSKPTSKRALSARPSSRKKEETMEDGSLSHHEVGTKKRRSHYRPESATSRPANGSRGISAFAEAGSGGNPRLQVGRLSNDNCRT